MRRYGNLYNKIYDLENIKLAHKKAKKGKSHYNEVRRIEENPDKYFRQIRNMLRYKTFRNSKYTIFKKMDKGKEREIFKLPYFPDRIIHHCIMNILEPIWMKIFIKDTYSSLKGRGIHKGIKRIKRALKDKEGTKYCLKLDIKKFYPSINHNILKYIIRKKIKDADLLWLLDEIIDSADGIPIGNYLSQYFGNLYLSYFDHWMKEYHKCKYYFRYCDDIIILDSNKKNLRELFKSLRYYLLSKILLIIKGSWQYFPIVNRGIDFLGYRFFYKYTLLRKCTSIRFKKKMKNICYYNINILSMIMSYFGWLKFANCYNLWKKSVTISVCLSISRYCYFQQINNPLEGNYNER